jgi:hypothetical protein
MESYLVEFAGLPGAGKSAISHALARLLRQRGLPVTVPRYDLDHRAAAPARVARKLAWTCAEVLRRPGATGRWLGALRRSRQPGVGVLATVAANWLQLGALMHRAARRPGVHLFDEGLLQALWSAGYEARAPEAAWPDLERALGAALPARLTVVAVDAPADALRRRLERRPPASRLDRALARGGESWDAGLARATAVYSAVLATAERLAAGGRLTLIRVRNDGATPGPAAVRIAATIPTAIQSERNWSTLFTSA